MRRHIIAITTLIIYLMTIVFHLLIISDKQYSHFTGFVMIIPLLVVLVYQRFILKINVWRTMSLIKPTKLAILLALFIPLSVGLITQLIVFTTKGQYFLSEDMSGFLFIFITLAPLIASALLEEVIWRGNFHYHLRKTYSLLKTSIITAIIWSIWHVPISILYKGYSNVWLGSIIYLVTLFVIGILLSYSREYGKSVIAPAIMHGTFNGFYFSKGINMTWSQEYIELILLSVLVLILMFYISFCLIIRKKKKSIS